MNSKNRSFQLSSTQIYINVLIIVFQLSIWVFLINVMHGNYSLLIKIPTLLLFCLVVQSIFSMMHECTHDLAFNNKIANKIVGCILSFPFGVIFSLYSTYHQGHHERNRSRYELADYIFSDESPLKKTVVYYIIILGGNWIVSFLSSLLLPLFPLSVMKKLAMQEKTNSYALVFLDFDKKKWNIMRLELFAFFLFWFATISFFHWEWRVLLICYGTLAFTWSSFQWIYHIRAPIHTVEGTFNLRLPKLFRLILLNFNYHLTHHRNPKINWHNLHRSSNQKETQPMLYRYIQLFTPPKPIPQEELSNEKTRW